MDIPLDRPIGTNRPCNPYFVRFWRNVDGTWEDVPVKFATPDEAKRIEEGRIATFDLRNSPHSCYNTSSRSL